VNSGIKIMLVCLTFVNAAGVGFDPVKGLWIADRRNLASCGTGALAGQLSF